MISDEAAARCARIFARAPRLHLPLPPCSISGAPFPNLLHVLLLTKLSSQRQRLANALEFLLDIAVVNKDAPTGVGAAGAAAREARMWAELSVLRMKQVTRSPRRLSRSEEEAAVQLRPPPGHVQVAPVVGMVYLFLRSVGADVDDWWARYYHAFVEPELERPLDGDATAGRSADAETGVVPPFYWLHCPPHRLRKEEEKEERLHELVYESRDGGGFASGSAVFATPLPLAQGSEAASPPRSAEAPAAPWWTAPTPRASVWVNTGLLRHVPFFPIPYPTKLPPSGAAIGGVASVQTSENSELGEPARGGAPGALPSSGMFFDEASPELETGEAEVEEWTSPSDPGGDEGGSHAMATLGAPPAVGHSLVEGPWSGAASNAESWRASSSSSALDVDGGGDAGAAMAAAAHERNWAHPFFDSLNVSERAMQGMCASWSDTEPQPANAYAAPEHSRRTLLDGLRRWRLASAEHPGLEVKAVEASGVSWESKAIAAKCRTDVWPPPALYCEMRPNRWRKLSTFWAAKLNMAAHLPCDYFFPFQAYPALHILRLMQMRQASPAARGRKMHLRCFPSAFRTTVWRRNGSEGGTSVGALRAQPWEESRFQAASGLGDGAELLDALGGFGTGPTRTTADSSVEERLNWLHRTPFTVSYFGQRYACVDSSLLACFFDSHTCTQHAIPLSEAGDPMYANLRAVRYRLQHSCCASSPSVCRGGQAPPSERSFGGVDQKPSPSHGGIDFPPCADGGMGVQSDSAARSSRKGRLSFFDAAMEQLANLKNAAQSAAMHCDASEAVTPEDRCAAHAAALSRSPWATRLRQICEQRKSGGYAPLLSQMERVIEMQTLQRDLHFLFRSPYWVEADSVFERWGVRVAPGAIPLRIAGTDFVNAEQTTDASRFNPQTCVPHLLQEVLCLSGRSKCNWDASQRLLALLTPHAAPRARRGGVRAWTHDTLLERAAAVQSVPNLWIAVAVLELFDWSVRPARPGCGPVESGMRPAAVQATIPVQDLLSATVRANVSGGAMAEVGAQTDYTSGTSPDACWRRDSGAVTHDGTPTRGATTKVALFFFAVHPGTPSTAGRPFNKDSTASAATSRSESAPPSLAVVHSSCITEQEELLFVAGFSPVVLVARVADLEPSDWGYADYMALRQGSPTHLCGDADREADEAREDETVEPHLGGGGAEAQTPRDKAEYAYQVAMRHKSRVLAEQWKRVRLRFSSRLDMAHLALQKGYHKSTKGRRWVLADVLRTAPLLRLVAGGHSASSSSSCTNSTVTAAEAPLPAPPGITAIQVELEWFDTAPPSSHSPSADVSGTAPDLSMSMGCTPSSSWEASDGFVRRFVSATLISEAELVWPDSLIQQERKRWVWKRL